MSYYALLIPAFIGHLNPMAVLGRALQQRGHRVAIVSALEVEEVYRLHAEIADCAVVGVADAEWGERVCAAIVPAPGGSPTPEELRAWGKRQLAVYKVPSVFVFVDALPRNTMGKVTKPDVAKLFV